MMNELVTVQVTRRPARSPKDGECGEADHFLTFFADTALDAGEEITICYDADADYLDLFERYGFFDTTAAVHTVEVQVDSSSWETSPGLSRLDEFHHDEALGAWWLPDHRTESAPLFRLIRSQGKSEAETAHAVAGVVKKQLSKYGTLGSE